MSVYIYSQAYNGAQYSQNASFTNPIIFKEAANGANSQIKLWLRHAILSGPGAESSSGVSVQGYDINSSPNDSSWIQIAPDASGVPGTYGAGGASVLIGDVPQGAAIPFWAKLTIPSGQTYGVKQDLELEVTATQTTSALPLVFSNGTATNCTISGNNLLSGNGYGYWLSPWISLPRTATQAATYTKTGTDGSISYRSSTDGTSATATAWFYDPTQVDNARNYLQVRIEFTGSNIYSNAVINSRPIGYWRLDETSSTATAIDIINANNLAINGSLPSTPGLIANDTDTARIFSAGNATGAGTAITPASTGAMTIEAWCNLTSVAANPTIAAKWNGGSSSFLFRVDGATPRLFCYNNGGYDYITSSVAININTTYHLVATYDGSIVRIYINGSLTASGGTRAPINNTYPFSIGLQGDSGQFTYGTIDEVAFYNTVLTQTQIQAHYNIGSGTLGSTTYSALSVLYAGAKNLFFDINIYDGPDTPVFVGPADGTQSQNYQPNLSVTVQNCDHVEFEVDTTTAFNSTHLQDWTIPAVVGGTTVGNPPANLAVIGIWYWRARGVLNGVVGGWMDPHNFVVLAIPNYNQYMYLNVNTGIETHDPIGDNRYMYLNVNTGIESHDPIVDNRYMYLNVNVADGIGYITYPIQDNTPARVGAITGDIYP